MKDFKKIIKETSRSNRIVAGFNVFGYEEAISVVKAAESIHAPVILMTNKFAVNHMPVEYWGLLLKKIADDAKVPVCVHLDHTQDPDIIARAIHSGYDSVMYDGSQLPLNDNIYYTREMVDYAHKHNIMIEGEIGSVGYSDLSENIYKSQFTDPEEAGYFAEKSGVDMLAVAIGTIHKLDKPNAEIQFDRIAEIEKATDIPLVIHGFSGVKTEDIRYLKGHQIGKVNIGTAIRQAMGYVLRDGYINNPGVYDRMAFMADAIEAAKIQAENKIRQLWYE
ncbi:MAG: class II fructose-bisphosphate aldolase [Spirochaetes bacterium]|nr:class II fructose-bisphosphate aldolase [Spirochaetota bacterium]